MKPPPAAIDNPVRSVEAPLPNAIVFPLTIEVAAP